MIPSVTLLAFTWTRLTEGWPYQLIAIAFFVFAGIFGGYWIWKRRYNQTLDAETEIARNREELKELLADLEESEKELETEA